MPVFIVNSARKLNSIYTINGDAPGTGRAAFSNGLSLPYAAVYPQADAAKLPWTLTDSAASYTGLAWQNSTPQQRTLQMLWQFIQSIDRADSIAWGAADQHSDSGALPWQQVGENTTTHGMNWADCPQQLRSLYALLWGSVPAYSVSKSLPWDTAEPHSKTLPALWADLAARDAYVALPWGGAGNYRTGYDIPYGQTTPTSPDDTHTIPDLLMYIMLPSFSVMSGGDNLDATSFTIGYNEGDTSYTFNATINRLKFPLVKVTPESGPIPITITANGFSWALQVEAYRDNMVFKQQSYTISGRGISAQLGPGIAPAKTYTEGSSKNISQLADQELADTGWALVYAAQDGLIPANKWTYSNLTPLEAIAELASKTGSVVVPDPISQTLTIRPGFPKSPWAWPAATPFAIIPAAFIASLSGQWSGSAATNGVYVTGQNGGVRVLIKRTGSDGAKQMQQVTDPLIVTAAIATERGRAELSKATKVKSETIVVPLLPGPVTSDNPGPLLPGALLQFHEPDSYAMDGTVITGATLLGKSVSWSLSGTRQGAAITIRQTVGIDLHNMAASV